MHNPRIYPGVQNILENKTPEEFPMHQKFASRSLNISRSIHLVIADSLCVRFLSDLSVVSYSLIVMF